MKRILSLILTAVFLFALSIPCGARGTETTRSREYPGFTDVAAGGTFYSAVRRCYEAGLLDPIGEDVFGVQEPISKADMVRLLARLYNFRLGGDGRIPSLPENLGDYVRFYGPGRVLVHNLFSARCLDFCDYGAHEMTVVFYNENLSQKRLSMEVGFPGSEASCSARGVRLEYDPTEDCTRYRFTFPEEIDVQALNLEQYHKDAMYWQSTWEVNREYSLEDPTPYDAVLYLLYGTPERLPLDSHTTFLDSMSYESVWRMELAIPLAALCQELPEVRDIDSIPDLPNKYFRWKETAAVLSLYRRGMLKGFDQAGTFVGADWLTRGQAALIGARFLDAIQKE